MMRQPILSNIQKKYNFAESELAPVKSKRVSERER